MIKGTALSISGRSEKVAAHLKQLKWLAGVSGLWMTYNVVNVDLTQQLATVILHGQSQTVIDSVIEASACICDALRHLDV